jgi:hypothetical protein
MMVPPRPDRDALSLDELKTLVVELLVRVSAQEEEIRQLRAENARLKDLPKKPKLAAGGMDKASEPERSAKSKARRRHHRGQRQSGPRTPPVTEERTLTVEVPPGSRRRGFELFTVQDLILAPQVIRFRRERWLTPEGRTVIAPMPAGIVGHFGPELRRFVLFQSHQGQVTVPRLVAQLRAIGITISKRQVVRLLNEGQSPFLDEARDVLRAGLASAAWISVDDTGARHKHQNGVCTQIGNDHFAAFASTASKSRLNFLEVLRAGHEDYVVSDAALAYMRTRNLSGPVIAKLDAHPERTFEDAGAWMGHLERIGITALKVTPDPVRIATEGALWGSIKVHGLLPDTAVLSDDAGQFAIDRHALCWVHAERLVHKLDTFTDRQHAAQQFLRALIWWFYADLKTYRRAPDQRRRCELRARFDRIFRRRTGFATLDRLLKRLHANKQELLLVLDRPQVPLHTNGSERDLRPQVIKRKISGGTRSDAGRDCRDAFLGLLLTCQKLGISFWEYLGHRLGVPGADAPDLPDLVRLRSATA